MCKLETYCETYHLIVRLTNIRNGERNSDRNETYKTYSVISQNLQFKRLPAGLCYLYSPPFLLLTIIIIIIIISRSGIML